MRGNKEKLGLFDVTNMIVGTVLSLIWLPTGYLIFERMSGRFSRRPDPVRTGTADGPKGRVPKKKLNRARAERV